MLRFAPSPTGPLHLGGLRTALLNSLLARKLGGKLILRVEDTDQTRLVPGSLEDITKGLEWATVNYDYGPSKPGPHGPYFQSQRLDLYRQRITELLESNKAYRCFCSTEELNAKRVRLAASGSSSTYDRSCLSLTDEEVARRVHSGQKHVVRFNYKVAASSGEAEDMIFGVRASNRMSLPTDPILFKSDGYPTYHLASVVDDHEMRITHVVRGEEWLPSLTLHLDLNVAFGFKPPTFAHLPILLNSDGSKMSKRHGDVRVADYIDRGWESTAVKTWLISAGWKGLIQDESLAGLLESLASHSTTGGDLKRFDLSSYSQRRAILESSFLEHLNKKALQSQDVVVLAERYIADFQDRFPNHTVEVARLARIIEAMIGRCATVKDIARVAPYFFQPPAFDSAESVVMRESIPNEFYLAALDAFISVSNSSQTSSAWLSDALKQYSGPKKHFWSSIRQSLSGQKNGPPLAEMIELLGNNQVLERAAASRVRESC